MLAVASATGSVKTAHPSVPVWVIADGGYSQARVDRAATLLNTVGNLSGEGARALRQRGITPAFSGAACDTPMLT